MRKAKLFVAMSTVLVAVSIPNYSAAETTEQKLQRLEQEMKELRQQLSATADQVESNAASKSAENDKTFIHSYGELHYNNLESADGTSTKDEIDLHRFVLEFGHEFSDTTRFYSELEVEHAVSGDSQNGGVEVEQAYVEHDFNDKLSAKAGVLLVPTGIINETHEPTTFYGVERNPVEKNIIPTTWWVGGVGVSGKSDKGFSYDVMAHEGLNIADDGAFNIRNGRQKTSKSKANDLAVTGRVKYTGMPGVELALTAQHQSEFMQGGSVNGGSANMLETHAIINKGKFSAKALYAQWDLNGVAAKAANKDKQSGGYIEGAYKITPKLGVFTRYNQWDNGGVGDTKQTQVDAGVNYWIDKNVVLKADYQDQSAGDGVSKSSVYDGFNLGVGYQF